MAGKKEQQLRFWLVMIAAIMFCTVGSGFYRNLSASDETYKGLKIFGDVVELIEKNYVDEVDSKKMIEKAIQGMVGSLDPHSQLLPPEAYEELKQETTGEFGGIGIVITMQKGVLTVISPIEGTPAYRAGVKAGDIIIKVDGKSTKEMMLWEAVKLMRGPKGEKVVITILREGLSKPKDFKLIRDIIPIESVKAISLKPGYGYVRVTNFQDKTTDDLRMELSTLEHEGLKGLVLDLRDNPGGLLTQAVQISDLFISEGRIVSIKGRLDRHTREFEAHDVGKNREYPIVVLINGGSASASEIVAGALQDHKRAVILGTTSFGKGSVQSVENLRDGYGLKFTIARYYTPSGKSIQAQGIVPDIIVKPQILDDSSEIEDEMMLKEKDLKNHLEAEPNGKTDKDADEKKEEKKPSRVPDSVYGPLSIESLRTDGQVMRALEILESHAILSGQGNGNTEDGN